MNSLLDFEKAFLDYCKSRVTEVTYNCWFKDLTITSFVGNTVTICATSNWKKGIIEDPFYFAIIKDAFTEFFSKEVNIVVTSAEENTIPLNPSNNQQENINHRYTFDNFIVGNSNRYAHAASLAVSDYPAEKYNPLFIYGKSGLGKTHLLKAIENHISEKFPDKRIVTVSCETFTNDFMDALNTKEFLQFHEKYRQCDVLLLDDIQFIAGKEGTQIEFFNTFEALFNSNKQMVITSDRPPKEIKTLTDRLRSRFEQGLLTDIQPPDFETRVLILKRKADELSLSIDENIIFFIAEQMKSNIRQLEGVIKKLSAISNLNERISISSAQIAIKDIKSDDLPEPITVKKIIDEVGKTFNVSAEDIMGKKRDANISKARHIAIYAVREIIGMSSNRIGEEFGRKHSTVLHSLEFVTKIMETDERDRNIICDLIENLKNN